METAKRVFDFLAYNKAHHDTQDILASKVAGKWETHSINDFIRYADEVSRGLLKLGIVKDDKVAIMSPNRPEWNFCDFGIMQIGAAQVPMYPTLAENDIRFILKDAEVKLIFVSDKALFDKIDAIKKELGMEIAIYSFDRIDGVAHWSEVQLLGKENPDLNLSPYKDVITGDDLLTLIYTSGTTGTPKGVMLTHGNLISNVLGSTTRYPEGLKKALSFLPLSHIFERMVCYMYFYLGVSVYYAESIEKIVDNLVEVKPHCFTAVPRLLEKVYEKIVSKGHALTGVKKGLFFWALNLAHKFEVDGKNGFFYDVQLSIARKLIFSKWREALGGNIMVIISGGAALQERLARVFWGADIKVLEGYGLTETSPVIAVNGPQPGETRFGTVGKLLPDVEVKIAADGEILTKGPNLMKGYYKRDDATKESITDGWFHTGDIGEMKDGFLSITDRKKEVFKTAGGKYVSPQVLENKLKESVYIEQVMVVGENKKFPAALIVPNYEKLAEWAARNGIKKMEHAAMLKDEKISEKIWLEIEKLNKSFGNWEQVKKFALIPDQFSIDAGEMTPKLSLKRKVILAKHADLIERIYKDEGEKQHHHF